MWENDSTPTVSKCLYSVAYILVSGLKGWTYQSSKWYCLCGIHCQFARAHSPEILFESLRGTEMVNSIYIYIYIYIEKYNLQFYSPMYTFILYIYIYYFYKLYKISIYNVYCMMITLYHCWCPLLTKILIAKEAQQLGKWMENEIWMVKTSY